MQRAKLLKDNRQTRHLQVWDPAFHSYQNHVDVDHKDVSPHNSLLEMLFTDAAHRGKLFRGQDLVLGSCKDHMGPQRTLMIAVGSYTCSRRACHTVSHGSPSSPPHLGTATPYSPCRGFQAHPCSPQSSLQ